MGQRPSLAACLTIMGHMASGVIAIYSGSMISAWMCFKATSLMVLMNKMLLQMFPMGLHLRVPEDLQELLEGPCREDVLEEEPSVFQ